MAGTLPGTGRPDAASRPDLSTKTSAEQWLIRTEADIIDSDWIDPDAGLIRSADYMVAWIDERPDRAMLETCGSAGEGCTFPVTE